MARRGAGQVLSQNVNVARCQPCGVGFDRTSARDRRSTIDKNTLRFGWSGHRILTVTMENVPCRPNPKTAGCRAFVVRELQGLAEPIWWADRRDRAEIAPSSLPFARSPVRDRAPRGFREWSGPVAGRASTIFEALRVQSPRWRRPDSACGFPIPSVSRPVRKVAARSAHSISWASARRGRHGDGLRSRQRGRVGTTGSHRALVNRLGFR